MANINEHMLLLQMAEAVSSDTSTSRQGTGRPSIEVNLDDIHYMLSLGFSRSKVAELFGISRKTLYNKIELSANPQRFSKYSTISTPALDNIARDIKRDHPNDGEIMVAGHLLRLNIKAQRTKLRESIHRVDPEGVAERRSIAVKRRKYHVERPNEVWHIDGHHKLIRW